MHQIYKKMKDTNGIKRFYQYVIKNKSFIILKHNQQILGGVAYFIDKKMKEGAIGSIFVANEFKGNGISKILYDKMLKEFKLNNLNIYYGYSTTQRVLSFSNKIGRVELASAYIVK